MIRSTKFSGTHLDIAGFCVFFGERGPERVRKDDPIERDVIISEKAPQPFRQSVDRSMDQRRHDLFQSALKV